MRRLTAAGMRGLPLPTAAQQAAFIEYLCYAHSWYKHLPLAGGHEFVLCLDDSTTRFAREVPLEQYRRECGYLNYAWRYDTARPFEMDWDENQIDVSAELHACTVTLFPYCSNDMNARECILLLHGRAPADGLPADVLAFLAAERIAEDLWHGEETPIWTEAEARAVSLYDALRAREVKKLEHAIGALVTLLAVSAAP